MPTIWTIGYALLMPEPLVAELEGEGIERLIDVRFRPQSRRPGMSKTRLAARLREAGIAYEHRRALGTPADLRALYRAGRIEEAATGYRRQVETHAAAELDALAAELVEGTARTALLCLEAEPATCHRREITEALRRRLDDLEVVDL